MGSRGTSAQVDRPIPAFTWFPADELAQALVFTNWRDTLSGASLVIFAHFEVIVSWLIGNPFAFIAQRLPKV